MKAQATSLALLLLGSPALAWEPISPSQPRWSGAVSYALHQAGSDDLDFATVERETRRGMEDWTGVACTGLTTRYEGVTSTAPRVGDGSFVIGWIESGWGHSGSAIGVTGTRFTSSAIVEADMEMNGESFTWTTDPGSGSRVNLYSIALHEGGHYYGLGHSPDRGAAMYYAYSGGVAALGADDRAGICALYPGADGGSSDCTATGCPSGQECVAGTCQASGGSSGGGQLCDPCTSSSDCGGAGDYCLGYPDGRGHCGTACSVDGDCAGGRCLTVSSGARQCVRFEGDAPSCDASAPPSSGGCTSDGDCGAGMRCDASRACVPQAGAGPIGAACDAHTDCASGTCMAGVCTQSCGWPGGSCPAGTYCDGGATGACGAGVCLAGVAGDGADGDPCGGPTECASLHCQSGRCAEPCVPGVVGACADGAICMVGALSCRGACGTAGSVGDPCAGNGDCASGLCASRGDAGFCTALCDASSPCGPGFACSAEGPVSVCVPDGGALGSRCEDNADCASALCAHEAERAYCTRRCDPAAPCAGTMACVASGTAGVSVCQPATGGGDGAGRPGHVGGCAIGGRRTAPPWPLALAALTALARRRAS